MTLLEKLTEATKNLTQVKTAVEAGEKSADELAAAIENVKTAQKNVDEANEAEALMKALETPAEEKADMEEKTMEYKSLGEFVAANVKEANIDLRKGPYTTPAFKVAAPMTIPSGVKPAITTYDQNVYGNRRELLIADLFAGETISNNALTFFVESSTVEGGPAYTT